MRKLLSRSSRRLIESSIDETFDALLAKLLGDRHVALSLSGLFENANQQERCRPDEDLRASILDLARRHVEGRRETTKAAVFKAIDSHLSELATGATSQDVKEALADVWKDTRNSLMRVVETETTVARNYGTLDGIVKVNSAHGISDPLVYFVTVRDGVRCDECTRLHLMDDGVKPRVWLLSEVGATYHKKGDPSPKLGGLHPACRCSLVTLMPGYGFDESGNITYVARDFSELESQR